MNLGMGFRKMLWLNGLNGVCSSVSCILHRFLCVFGRFEWSHFEFSKRLRKGYRVSRRRLRVVYVYFGAVSVDLSSSNSVLVGSVEGVSGVG